MPIFDLAKARDAVVATFPWIATDLAPSLPIQKNDTGRRALVVQELLCFAGFGTSMDGDFGHATAMAVQKFQKAAGLTSPMGVVDNDTFLALAAPVIETANPVCAATSFPAAVVEIAKRHLAERVRELGGENRGVWVRLYTGGRDGSDWPWCAAFVSFVLSQAARATGRKSPLPYTASCDVLATEAKARNIFVPSVTKEENLTIDMPAIFLNRKSPGDWTHTGFAIGKDKASFSTIEGNTEAHTGSYEGDRVQALQRKYENRDFIRLA
ncbi:MAG: peptidoglycan-binding protein [Zavarzinia sp.]|nr:peptidoglycan-binding protein [Zavarzinia sp.]